eukprot:TRINITY_DN39795_c0_g1_i2.p3 TRINITY_DN39795_c0_g1~~TRINITY_DN39795_c0_g1_i2.p3  ORF type:complete len:106 (-),score=0.27 TRINITY_DN39795_c0_g1_i2:431-748(-)
MRATSLCCFKDTIQGVFCQEVSSEVSSLSWRQCPVNVYCRRMCFEPKGLKECMVDNTGDRLISFGSSEVICMCGCRYPNMCVAKKSNALPCMPVFLYEWICQRPY